MAMSRALENRIKRLEQLRQERSPQDQGGRGLFGLTASETQEAADAYFSAFAANGEPQPPSGFGAAQQAAFFELVMLFRRLDEEI